MLFRSTAFLTQVYATDYRNAALVAFAYNGSLILVPRYDDRRDIINAGSVNFTVDNATPWKEFANGPFGSIWGDWNTTQQEFVDRVVSETIKNVELDIGYQNVGFGSAAQALAFTQNNEATRNLVWSELSKKGYSQADYILGNVTVLHTDASTGKKTTVVNGKFVDPGEIGRAHV